MAPTQPGPRGGRFPLTSSPSYAQTPPSAKHHQAPLTGMFSSNPSHYISQQPRQNQGTRNMLDKELLSSAPTRLMKKEKHGSVQWMLRGCPSFHHWWISSQILRFKPGSSIIKVGFSFLNSSWIFPLSNCLGLEALRPVFLQCGIIPFAASS